MAIYRSSQFAVVRGETTCWNCQVVTPVAALLLGPHEMRWDDEDDWAASPGPVMLMRVTQLNPEALDVYVERAPWIRRLNSKTVGTIYWGNACTTCETLQGDWYLTEPGAPFFPEGPKQEEALVLTWHEVPIELEADGSESSWIDRLVNKFSPTFRRLTRRS